MKREESIVFTIEPKVVNSYVNAINSIKIPMVQIKEKLNALSGSINDTQEKLMDITMMLDIIKSYSIKYPNDQIKIYMDAIKQIMIANKGMLSTRMIEPLHISRQYLSIMEKDNVIERVSRGIYLLPESLEDSYYSFQQKYKKAIYSHMNALYFYDLTEEFPYNYTVTVPQRYHVDTVNNKCNVFYVSEEIYELGLVEIETPSGNKIMAYDIERCICDIIRSKGRMDLEQVNKTIKAYKESKKKDYKKLERYAQIMGIKDKVMSIINGVSYE